ncbi:MAG: glycosyltransferase, partial [Pyrinomonadaceae bacterium]
GVIARKFSKNKPKILFDIRGFFPEEYTDAGIWPKKGWVYRSVKRVEKWLLAESDGFVVLTEKARDIMFPGSAESGRDERGRPVEVIPCCVDLSRFPAIEAHRRIDARNKLQIGDRFVLAYVGSFGGWYLSDEMFELFAAARDLDPTVFILILTQRNADVVARQITALGFGEGDFFVDSVLSTEIPYYLNMADAAVSFIKPCYSKQASSPTKNAEYLASGLPFIANPGVGDVDRNILDDQVGVLVKGFGRDDYEAAIRQLEDLGDIRDTCRDSAKKRFDLKTVGGVRYRRVYKRLLG